MGASKMGAFDPARDLPPIGIETKVDLAKDMVTMTYLADVEHDLTGLGVLAERLAGTIRRLWRERDLTRR